MSSARRPSDAPAPPASPHPSAAEGMERRSHPRVEVTWPVDYAAGDTFLFATITNVSALGIFIASHAPPPVGSALTMRFTPPDNPPFEVHGEVAWVNPLRDDGDDVNPGFGVRFIDLDPDMRERLVSLVHAIAYLPSPS